MTKSSKEKILVRINRDTWRTGSVSDVATGKGCTLLKNPEGYMCCLGSVALATVDEKVIYDQSGPSELNVPILSLSELQNHLNTDDRIRNTSLTTDAMAINDDEALSLQEKEERLIALFEDSPYTLEFYGEPVPFLLKRK